LLKLLAPALENPQDSSHLRLNNKNEQTWNPEQMGSVTARNNYKVYDVEFKFINYIAIIHFLRFPIVINNVHKIFEFSSI
jgi:hypothetical protein